MNHSTISQLCRAFAVAAAFAPAITLAQPPGGGPGGFGGTFGGGGLVGLVMREDVQQEIQLVDEQLDKVAAVAEESRENMWDELRSLRDETRDLGDEERRERFRSKMAELSADTEAKLAKALLPHQLQRLKQIDLQTRMQSRFEGGLSSRAVADALELSEEQRENLEQRAEEVRQELQDKIRQAQAEAREKLLDVLTPEQKAKLQELTGEAFQMNEDRFFGRGGFRGRGGRDGERGNRENGRGTERRDADEAN
jgi:Spy/CpxP family protein refolding chaperone